MFRRLLAAAALAGTAALVAPAGLAGATAAGPIPLLVPAAVAWGLIGHQCTPPQEYVTAEGFDPTTGFPIANVEMTTACSSGGKGGGGHGYSAYAGAMWDDAGTLVAIEPLYSNPGTGPGFTAYDAYGNEEYQSVATTYLQWAPGFVPVPRVTGLSVTAGSTAGGETETVSGSGFTNATTVDVGSTAVPFTVVDDTTLTFVTPPDAVTADTAVDVTVSSTQGTSATSSADQFTYTLPQVTGLSVTDGPSTGGTAVVVTGVGFLGATSVAVGTVPVSSFTVVDDTTIDLTTAADTTLTDDATLDVSVTSPSGTGTTSPADQFTYAVAPRITSITPSSGPLSGGTTITIDGADLAYGTKLVIGETPVFFWYNADGSISAQTPAGDAYQGVPVTLTTDGGTSAGGRASQFTYVQGTPTLDVVPSSGPVGTTIGISGADFRIGEKVTVTYTTDLPTGKSTVTLCRTTADAVGSFGCGGVVPAKLAGPAGDHVITATGKHGKVVDTAAGVFTLT